MFRNLEKNAHKITVLLVKFLFSTACNPDFFKNEYPLTQFSAFYVFSKLCNIWCFLKVLNMSNCCLELFEIEVGKFLSQPAANQEKYWFLFWF